MLGYPTMKLIGSSLKDKSWYLSNIAQNKGGDICIDISDFHRYKTS